MKIWPILGWRLKKYDIEVVRILRKTTRKNVRKLYGSPELGVLFSPVLEA